MDGWTRLYIDGTWIERDAGGGIVVDEAATGKPIATVARATENDVDNAVDAAVRAFQGWAATPVAERVAIVRRIADGLAQRREQLAVIMTREVGTPITESRRIQVDLPLKVFRSMADLAVVHFAEERIGHSVIIRQPVGVVAAVTPWNYPLYQIAAKVAPALVAGCPVVLKPSSVAPLSALVLAGVAAKAGLPPGVLNVLTGSGAAVGEWLCGHPEVDMVSLTGSTQAGARAGAHAISGIKRVTLELGGKSANVICEDADLDAAIPAAVRACFVNNGQTCAALTRLLVPRHLLGEVEERLAAEVAAIQVGDPLDVLTRLGPVASAAQRSTVASYIQTGTREGRLIAGGAGPVEGLDEGYFVRPTVFSDVSPDAVISREEIFGPVLTVTPVSGVDEAVDIANDSEYGLSGGVWAGDNDRALTIARRLRTGQVAINGGRFNVLAPFGGYRKSGIGRELGREGLAEYTEFTAYQLPVA